MACSRCISLTCSPRFRPVSQAHCKTKILQCSIVMSICWHCLSEFESAQEVNWNLCLTLVVSEGRNLTLPGHNLSVVLLWRAHPIASQKALPLICE